MPVPPKRRSRSSKRERAAHFALKPITLVSCAQCKKPILPHRVCAHCGHYAAKPVIKTRADKRAEKKTARAQTEHKAQS